MLVFAAITAPASRRRCTITASASAGLPRDKMRLDVQCLLVKAGDHVILFDTGFGKFADANSGLLPSSLAAAGVTPAAVTDIFISHTHSDHVGGLVTKEGALAFPSATIHVSAPEWASLQADPDKDAKELASVIAPKVVAFDPGAQVLPAVKAVDTRGHTPGHSSYVIGTGSDKLFYLGDLAHHYVISVRRGRWPSTTTTRPAQPCGNRSSRRSRGPAPASSRGTSRSPVSVPWRSKATASRGRPRRQARGSRSTNEAPPPEAGR